MSNEKNVKEKENVILAAEGTVIPEVTETSVENVAIVEGDAVFTGLYLERKKYLHEGKERFYCFVGGTLRGRNVEAGIDRKSVV